MSFEIGCWVTPRISWNNALAADGLECESTTTTPSLVRITAAFEFTLYWGAAIAAYTPSATGLSSKRSLVTVLPSAGKTQQGSRCIPCVLIRESPHGVCRTWILTAYASRRHGLVAFPYRSLLSCVKRNVCRSCSSAVIGDLTLDDAAFRQHGEFVSRQP